MPQATLIALQRLREALKVQIEHWETFGAPRAESDIEHHLTLHELRENLAEVEKLIEQRSS